MGSIAVITKETGTAANNSSNIVVERLAFDPWGKRRFPNGLPDLNDAIVGVNTDRGYTEHEHLDEMGVIHMNGRVYDPLIWRFMSADPFISHPFNLQGFNRYAYVCNNPLKYTDPSGYCDNTSPVPCEAPGPNSNGSFNPNSTNPCFGQGSTCTGNSVVTIAGGSAVYGSYGYTNSVCGGVNCNGTTAQMSAYTNSTGSFLVTSHLNTGQISCFMNSECGMSYGGSASASNLLMSPAQRRQFKSSLNETWRLLRTLPEIADIEARYGSMSVTATYDGLGSRHLDGRIIIDPSTLLQTFWTAPPREWDNLPSDQYDELLAQMPRKMEFDLVRVLFHEAFHRTQKQLGMAYYLNQPAYEKPVVDFENKMMYRYYNQPYRYDHDPHKRPPNW